ncbi:MAG: UDP-N-acetylglucosamine--N-acetylmuramyl-(pentapeptide) pyrophosphoryl-undecaprenol N-acetylglucosamine transferase [Candidatus Pacebacteria bacterium]|jgi:UDP-N-acetylglucosamine--N-acetylmuramyl-(pentapeptide) pyrophosphoryl-undecaprenol N-acetylglucosamine transferase|nr:UDP-N-acetylglucosamine--N-acetylmuramyl-(pentapeptide) pyrophosphoryl-undecaprenol N-acetylglucosamine transferase [Candidatus Paceibacterota bacterium]MBT4004827.1 UDP-N-acetylglucosamine--N-acetylmuramyl-(pentapeptide) pyrophosphoryl-undecaprenol N-acetylglucosamine transferase [Candidatus Paceibacterota bacterium]MBT4358466.1 UDP-N-acetylglucosamine--N-acetylmuramyl-(pentapeptide) pyrophosphoryl-undecaprenol N-acetylglucosamine transferase [Candidatus Paceibacterota bacterium]MBT4681121.1
MKILISGGHLTPALSLIDFINKNHQKDEVVFVGRKYSQNELKQLAQEKNEVEKRQIKFIHLSAAKTVNKKSLLHKFYFPFLFVKSVAAALTIFKQEKPNIFVSFGGYMAIPLAIAAKLTGTKIFTHEQTHAVGLANQFIAKFADEVAISYPSSKKYFPKTQTHLTGNPIRSSLLDLNSAQPKWISQDKIKPILLITGGSQGSQAINKVIQSSIHKLTEYWTVIHLCGSSNLKSNYRLELEKIKNELPSEQQQYYFIKEWANGSEMSWIYNHTHSAISRAGANTVMELTIKNIPTIFIPLPNSHHHEQLKNAQELSEKNAALIIDQKQLTTETLLNNLSKLKKNRQEILNNLSLINRTTKAVEKIYQLLISLNAA